MLALAVRGAAAELLPSPALPDTGRLRVTIEILPVEPDARLSQDVRRFEGARLTIERLEVEGARYRKSTLVLPLPTGDTLERVIFFAEEDERLRMLGFHRIHRHQDTPRGETIVFNAGPENPLQGRALVVPPDTQTYLSFFTTLGGIVAAGAPARAHLWNEDGEPLAVEIAPSGAEELGVLGTRVRSRRLRLRPLAGEAAEASYWFAEEPPHSFLQYRGPGDFLVENGERVPTVVLRATSSSEQVDRIFGGS